MKPRWAISLAIGDAPQLAALRKVPRVEVCTIGDSVWCRGDAWNDAVERQLLALPGAYRYEIVADEQITPAGQLVPTARLPDGAWIPLANWLELELPPARTAVRPRSIDLEPVQLRLVRSACERAASCLLTTMPQLQSYAETAAAIRLAQWSFVLRTDGSCIVRGIPLPPIAGTQLVEIDGLLVPAGWEWRPAVDAQTVRTLLGLQAKDIALFDRAGSWELIAPEQWVQATRSAIRLSQAGVHSRA